MYFFHLILDDVQLFMVLLYLGDVMFNRVDFLGCLPSPCWIRIHHIPHVIQLFLQLLVLSLQFIIITNHFSKFLKQALSDIRPMSPFTRQWFRLHMFNTIQIRHALFESHLVLVKLLGQPLSFDFQLLILHFDLT